jgi:CubicO group peptidase (beta-lactamase class C family)
VSRSCFGFFAVLLSLFGCASPQVPAPAPGGGLAERVDRFVLNETASGFAGSVLLAKNGEVILHKGYGPGIAPETSFWVASISKQFTAAAILKLAEQGKLSVDDPITKYFEEVPEDKRGITIHQLLTHTSGFQQKYAADGITDRKEAARALLAQPLKSPPGQGFSYSNDAYNLLAILVEAVSGEPFETFLERHLFAPAGLRQTGFWGGPGHEKVAVIPGEVPESSRRPNWGFRGATGIYSTTGDLYRWYRALQENRVLSEESRKKLLAPHVALGGTEHAAYGWFLTSAPRSSVWTRGTESFGHNAIVMAYPDENLVLVAASNAGERERVSRTRKLAADLAELLFDAP